MTIIKPLAHIWEKMKSMDKDSRIGFLRFCMPYGSGFDTDFEIEENKKCYIIRSAYHCMDSNGFYCGWIDFTIHFWKDIPCNKGKDFTFCINGRYSHYLADKHYLRGYISEAIYEHMYYTNVNKFEGGY